MSDRLRRWQQDTEWLRGEKSLTREQVETLAVATSFLRSKWAQRCLDLGYSDEMVWACDWRFPSASHKGLVPAIALAPWRLKLVSLEPDAITFRSIKTGATLTSTNLRYFTKGLPSIFAATANKLQAA